MKDDKPKQQGRVENTTGNGMSMAMLLQAEIYTGDLRAIDKKLFKTGPINEADVLQLKSVLVTLANVRDFEATARFTYREYHLPSTIYKPLRKHFDLAKYLRNKFVGHMHPELLAQALERSPLVSKILPSSRDRQMMVLINLWLLETAINTYVEEDGQHKVFDTVPDLLYPPEWEHFGSFMLSAIDGAMEYLKLLREYWGPKVALIPPAHTTREEIATAGRQRYKYLTQ
ncbi:hypothetical protein [uncultured Oxalicibacterium sp.]|uniref:hypothetical protein n=1 Tax=uncultured Oxalicibacterium sp. TaxID=1168540 RepID=UPI0025D0634D|nr:hypothetical protein [uncultured Oxalicibacterium sp.]